MTDPFVSEVADKVARQQPLSVEEIQRWHDWFQVASGQLAGLFNRTTAGEIDVLSDVTPNLGTMYKGEFIAVKEGALSLTPTNLDFTGSFMSAYGYVFNGVNYKVGSVKNGVLGFGFNEEGQALAAAGNMYFDHRGVFLQDSYILSQLSAPVNSTNTDDVYYGGFYVDTNPTEEAPLMHFGYIAMQRKNTNLLANGDFSTQDLTSWTATGSPSVVNDSPTGQYSVSVNSSDYVVQSAATTAGKDYALYLAVRREGSGADFPWVQIGSGGSNVALKGFFDGEETNWIRGVFIFRATDSSTEIKFFSMGSDDIRFTNIECYELDSWSFSGDVESDHLGNMRLYSWRNITLKASNGVGSSTQINLNAQKIVSEVPLTVKESATPTTPIADYGAIYPKTDGKWYIKDDGGTETQLALGTGTVSGTNTGDVTLGSFGSSPNANGASLSGQVLTLQPASGTQPGGLSTGSQTIGGAKTFSSTLTADTAIINGSSSAPLDISNIRAGGYQLTLRTIPTANSQIGDTVDLAVNAKNSAGTQYQSGLLRHIITDPTNGSEDSRWDWYVKIAGAAISLRMSLDTNLTLADGLNFILNATTGTKVGTATTQKLGFWNATPIVRPTLSSLTTYSVTNLTTDRTFDANTAVLAEIADVLGTLCQDFDDLKAKIITTGLLG